MVNMFSNMGGARIIKLVAILIICSTGDKTKVTAHGGVCILKMVDGKLQKIGSCKKSKSALSLEDKLSWYNYKASNGRSYKLSRGTKNYNSAKNECVKLRTRLASTGIRNTTVIGELVSKFLTGIEKIWIGLSEQGQEGQWVWSDESPYNRVDTFWGTNQPDNGRQGKVENCGALKVKSKKLHDFPCADLFRYLCEF